MSSYIKIPKILLPNEKTDLEKWSVIACDQFTSQEGYWEQLKEYIQDAPSTLNLIFPEVYLNKVDQKEVVKEINAKMKEYLESNLFNEVNNFIYVERKLTDTLVRKGLIICVDLEAYDYSPNAKMPIRATEKTVRERLPVRVEIRKDATLDLPHICLFMDDIEDKVFGLIKKNKESYNKLYDFELNMNGGHITGYEVSNSSEVKKTIDSLLNKELLREKYGIDDELLFVVGDGNHSLATAKECWNLIKKNLSEEEIKKHPARYALCELQNIHDSSIIFEPIHRFLKNANSTFIKYLSEHLKGEGSIRVVYGNKEELISVNKDPTIAIADIQKSIDDYLLENDKISLDYIHGDSHLRELIEKEKGVAIFMPKVEKNTLFDYVVKNGVMPRKSFSIGSAESKRYYLESQRLY